MSNRCAPHEPVAARARGATAVIAVPAAYTTARPRPARGLRPAAMPARVFGAMVVEDVGNGVVRLAVRLAGLAVALPVVAGFVTLGAAVLVGRSVREATRRGRTLFPWWRDARRDESVEESQAA